MKIMGIEMCNSRNIIKQELDLNDMCKCQGKGHDVMLCDKKVFTPK